MVIWGKIIEKNPDFPHLLMGKDNKKESLVIGFILITLYLADNTIDMEINDAQLKCTRGVCLQTPLV